MRLGEAADEPVNDTTDRFGCSLGEGGNEPGAVEGKETGKAYCSVSAAV